MMALDPVTCELHLAILYEEPMANLEAAIEAAQKACVPPGALRSASELIRKSRAAEAAIERALLTPGDKQLLEQAIVPCVRQVASPLPRISVRALSAQPDRSRTRDHCQAL